MIQAYRVIEINDRVDRRQRFLLAYPAQKRLNRAWIFFRLGAKALISVAPGRDMRMFASAARSQASRRFPLSLSQHFRRALSWPSVLHSVGIDDNTGVGGVALDQFGLDRQSEIVHGLLYSLFKSSSRIPHCLPGLCTSPHRE